MSPSFSFSNPFLELMSKDDRARYLKSQRMWRARLARERRALMRLKGDDFASAAIAYLSRFSSEKRGSEMLSLLQSAPPEIVWKIFLEVWTTCDCTWELSDMLIRQLNRASSQIPARSFFSYAQRTFLQSLPANVTVFRGCSRQRANGLAWTTDEAVAKSFASGQRGIVVREPALVTASVKKGNILAVFTDRGESGVICVPSRILRIDDVHDIRGLSR